MDIKDLKINRRYKLHRGANYDIARLISFSYDKLYRLHFKYEDNNISESCWSYSRDGIGFFLRDKGRLKGFLELIED